MVSLGKPKLPQPGVLWENMSKHLGLRKAEALVLRSRQLDLGSHCPRKGCQTWVVPMGESTWVVELGALPCHCVHQGAYKHVGSNGWIQSQQTGVCPMSGTETGCDAMHKICSCSHLLCKELWSLLLITLCEVQHPRVTEGTSTGWTGNRGPLKLQKQRNLIRMDATYAHILGSLAAAGLAPSANTPTEERVYYYFMLWSFKSGSLACIPLLRLKYLAMPYYYLLYGQSCPASLLRAKLGRKHVFFLNDQNNVADNCYQSWIWGCKLVPSHATTL